MTFEDALQAWAEELTKWYFPSNPVTPEEVKEVFDSCFSDRVHEDAEGTAPYVDVFLRTEDGGWTASLDTADREEMADAIYELHARKEPKKEK